jgi:hypothetical protein
MVVLVIRRQGHGLKWALVLPEFEFPKSFRPGKDVKNPDEWLFYCLRSADQATRLRILRAYEWTHRKLEYVDSRA